MEELNHSSIWQVLCEQAITIKQNTLQQWFKQDPERAQRYVIEQEGLYLDFSKNWINDETLTTLLELASQRGLKAKIEALFRGDKINVTEQRAVLHTALRDPSDSPIWVDGENIKPLIKAELHKMTAFAGKVRSGLWKGYTGKAITNIVHIGIGGSYLGPKLVYQALKSGVDNRLPVHFISNVDCDALNQVLDSLNPETTLFVVVSKTFTTQETLLNAQRARIWLLNWAGKETAVAQHFVAVSANLDAISQFGIDKQHCFSLWDWVGGRFSLWSAVGLSVMIALGSESFSALLAGAHSMDQHFKQVPWAQNMPIILGMLGIWYTNFHHASTHMLAPYNDGLAEFVGYLQQLDMESNGKSATLNGHEISYMTAPIVWGELGNNAQHAFFQLLHQSHHLVPVDFIVALTTPRSGALAHTVLVSNMIAQAEALMRGKTDEEVRDELQRQGVPEMHWPSLIPAKRFPGNRPSNVLLLDRLDPYHLGQLLALYEHKIFVQGVIWNINSFDQWGVELGKQLAQGVLAEIESPQTIVDHDASTVRLIQRYQKACWITKEGQSPSLRE